MLELNSNLGIMRASVIARVMIISDVSSYELNPQTPQATVCCYVGAAALVHFRSGRLGPQARGFNFSRNEDRSQNASTLDG